MAPEFAIVTDEPGWHGARLRESFAALGANARYVSLQECRFDITDHGHDHAYNHSQGLRLPGFDSKLPAGVFVRGVPGGSLEQVVLYLDVLHALQEMDVLVYNNARAIERSVDKAMTSFLLHRASLPTPPTWVSANYEQAAMVIRREVAAGHELVIKPVFGSQGIGLQRIRSLDQVNDPEFYNGVYYLQRFIDTGEGEWHDWRVFVVRGRAIAGMRRNGVDWISNVANGGRCQAAVLDEEMSRLAVDAADVVNMNYAGVDLLRDQQGKLWVTEVNSIPAWKGLQGACNLNIADILVKDFLDCLGEQTAMDTAG